MKNVIIVLFLAVLLFCSPMMAGDVTVSLRWTCAANDQLLAAWAKDGFKSVCCNEPGYDQNTSDNYLGVKLGSEEIKDYELFWSYRVTPELLDSWKRLGYVFIMCNEPGLEPNSEDNYLAINLILKDPGKKANIKLNWTYSATPELLRFLSKMGYSYVQCHEPELGGATADNYLILQITIP